MNVIDFKLIKDKRDGKITPEMVLQNSLDHVDDIDKIVLVIRTKDKEIIYGASEMNQVETLGMLEVGKARVLNDMWVDEE